MTRPKLVMPDGRAHIDAEMSEYGYIMIKGKKLTNHEAVKLTGKTLMMIRDRMYKTDMTLDEAVNSPIASGDSRIGPTALHQWTSDYREWKASLNGGEAPPERLIEDPPPPTPNLPVAQHRFRLEVTAIQPADIAHLHLRLDKIEKLLTDLITEWQGSKPE